MATIELNIYIIYMATINYGGAKNVIHSALSGNISNVCFIINVQMLLILRDIVCPDI